MNEENKNNDSSKETTPFNGSDENNNPWGMELKTYCMLMHLSMLGNFLIPMAGLVLPIIMWATNKDQFKEVDIHGRNIFNWMLSMFIYFCICVVLVFVLVGIPLMIVLGIVNIVFVIIGAIKANDGIYWKYPLSIDVFGFARLKG